VNRKKAARKERVLREEEGRRKREARRGRERKRVERKIFSITQPGNKKFIQCIKSCHMLIFQIFSG
jgi:hypothetical protein